MDTGSNMKDAELRDRFYQYYKMQSQLIEEQIDNLHHQTTSGGEQQDARDHCLASISRLQEEIQAASFYTLPHDQKIFAEKVKFLRNKAETTFAALMPKPKFSFKMGLQKNSSALSVGDFSELERLEKQGLPGYGGISGYTSFAGSPNPSKPTSPRTELQAPPLSLGSNAVAKALPIQSRSNLQLHIEGLKNRHAVPVAPAEAKASPCIISDVSNTIIDLRKAQSSTMMPSLTVRDVKNSVLICGTIDGAAHLTGLTDSIVVVASRQVRIHESTSCTLYLRCSSQPIIETCKGMIFQPLPQHFAQSLSAAWTQTPDRWSEVQDFSWLKQEANPNWTTESQSPILTDSQWDGALKQDPESTDSPTAQKLEMLGLHIS